MVYQKSSPDAWWVYLWVNGFMNGIYAACIQYTSDSKAGGKRVSVAIRRCASHPSGGPIRLDTVCHVHSYILYGGGPSGVLFVAGHFSVGHFMVRYFIAKTNGRRTICRGCSRPSSTWFEEHIKGAEALGCRSKQRRSRRSKTSQSSSISRNIN